MSEEKGLAEMAGSVLPEKVEFPAHKALTDMLDEWKRIGGTTITFSDPVNSETLISEFDLLFSRYQALKDAVIVLEEGAEPQVGDILFYNETYWACYIKEQCTPEKTADYLNDSRNNLKEGHCKVIQRNGKPVIYKSNITEIK